MNNKQKREMRKIAPSKKKKNLMLWTDNGVIKPESPITALSNRTFCNNKKIQTVAIQSSSYYPHVAIKHLKCVMYD